MVDLLRETVRGLEALRQGRREVTRILTARRTAQGEIRRLDRRLVERRRVEAGTRRALQERQKRVRRRIRALYRLVRQTASLPMIDPRRARVPADGRAALIRILRRDQAEVRHLRAELLRAQNGIQEGLERHRQAVAVLRDLDRRWDERSAQVARAEQRVAGLRYERDHFRGGAHEWTAEALRLEKQVVALLVARQHRRPSFESLRGRLLRPVPGMIVRWFGEHRVAGTKATERCRGVEISALPRWKVRAPAAGTVRYSGRIAGQGAVIVLDHGAGYLSVLAHVGSPSVRPGQRVRAGGVVATVGTLGGRRVARIYYELRRGAQPMDPAAWLRGGLAERRERESKRRPRRPLRRTGGSGSTVVVERTD